MAEYRMFMKVHDKLYVEIASTTIIKDVPIKIGSKILRLALVLFLFYIEKSITHKRCKPSVKIKDEYVSYYLYYHLASAKNSIDLSSIVKWWGFYVLIHLVGFISFS